MIEMVYKGETAEGSSAIVLPKNVRQVGEVQKDKKVYIEDYVVTYMKQKITENKNLGCVMILTGRKEYTPETMYMFVDGAFAVEYGYVGSEYIFGDKIWSSVYDTVKKYFITSEIVGWVIYDDNLDEEKLLRAQRKNFPAEDMLLLKQEAYEDESVCCLYRGGSLQRLQGFFVYYEKNECMQEFMVDNCRTDNSEEEEQLRQREIPAAQFRSKMRDRHSMHKSRPAQSQGTPVLYAVSSVLLLLVILAGISMVNNIDRMQELKASLNELTGPDQPEISADQASAAEEEPAVETGVPGETKEPEVAVESEPSMEEEDMNALETQREPEAAIEPGSSMEEEDLTVQETPKEPETTEEPIPSEVSEPVAVETKVYYTIERGDTLAGISRQIYGDAAMINKICELNGIEDGDKIQAGQKILLP